MNDKNKKKVIERKKKIFCNCKYLKKFGFFGIIEIYRTEIFIFSKVIFCF